MKLMESDIQQECPSAALQRRMLEEEQAFLRGMRPGLQHEQMLAVRAAMAGDDEALRRIRAGRNQAPALPEGVATSFPLTDLCLFAPVKATDRKLPILLYLHGGGWCFGSINSCARFCAAVALAADCCVAALNYRLAPAHPFPAPLHDCQRAFAYLRRHAGEWGCDPDRVSVGGDSAGGNLALATALSVEGVHRVVPIYPVIQLHADETASWRLYATGYGDDAELLEAFCEAYAAGAQPDPLASPGMADDDALRSLPPVLLVSAGHDALFDQARAFATRLRRLSHPVAYHVYPTATHLFITVPGQPTAFAEAVKTVADFLADRVKNKESGGV